MDDDQESKDLIEYARRVSAFEAFNDSTIDKRELAEVLAVSRPTAHRIIASFEGRGILERGHHGYELTRYGEIVGASVTAYRDEISIATSLRPLLNNLPEDIDLDHRLFEDAVVTKATYDDPFRPMNRFIEQFEGATQIKAFNKSFLEPMYIDLAHDQIMGGMESDIIYEPKVLELVLEEYPNLAQAALESEQMQASVHDDLPIALAVFKDRIGIGIHTESMGTPISWIDTDNPEAIAWGEALFDRYAEEATWLH